MAEMRLSLLGPLSIERHGEPVRGFESRKAIALLCYLALERQPRSRSFLAELFWEGKSETRGRGNLSRVLHNLARVAPGCLITTNQTVTFDPNAAWIDVAVFEALVAQGDSRSLGSAADLYRGDLMADLLLDECPAFEQWLEVMREHWRQRQVQLLHRLIEHHQHQGTIQEGIAWATRLLQLDPWNEQAHRTLMLLLNRSGQRSAALAQYETCRNLLAEELGMAPEAATVALYESIRAGVEPDAAGMYPPPVHHLLPAVTVQRTLPTPTTPFVGREDEVARILTHLHSPSCRMVTIVGPGGAGKTRLALQVAQQIAAPEEAEPPFPHGVVFVALSAGTSEENSAKTANATQELTSSIAAAMNLPLIEPASPQAQVINTLREKRLLLVLDNFEYWLATADFVVNLLQQAPQLKIIITSRVRLNVPAEQIVELEGLAFPSGREALTPGNHTNYSAVNLFQQQAVAVDPQFLINGSNWTTIARICRLVGGLPLGIELAASWVRLLSCQEILQEIEANLSFLQSSRPQAQGRHHSLRAVFDHSWDLLSPEAQQAFSQLAVFHGGFDRSAAEQVAGASLPILAVLVDNSLVRRTTQNDAKEPSVRYDLLEVIRQYAQEKLLERSDSTALDQVREWHCHYYQNWLHQLTPELRGHQQQQALAMIHHEIENIRASWQWAITHERIDLIDCAIESLFHFYDMRSWFQEGEAVFAQATARLSALLQQNPTAELQRVLARVLARQGWFTFHVGQHNVAQQLLEQSLALLRSLHASTELVFPLNYLAAVTAYLGNYPSARQYVQEALATSKMLNDTYGIAIAHNILSQIALAQGDYTEAERACRESALLERAIGNRWSMAFSLNNLGAVALALHNYTTARRRFQESLAIRKAFEDLRGMALCLNYLGDTAAAHADYTEARWRYEESLALFKEIGHQSGAAATLIRMGYNALAMHEPETAHSYFSDALRRAVWSQDTPRMLDALLGLVTVIRHNDPDYALSLAHLIQQHPSATRASRERAATIYAHLASRNATVAVGTDGWPPANSLEEVVAILLGEE